MQIEVKVESLKGELNFLRNATDRKNKSKSNAAHRHVLIETGTNEIRLTATEGTMTIVTRVPAAVAATGSRALLGDKFFDVVSALQGDSQLLLVGQPNDRTLLKCERYQGTISGMRPADFPPTPAMAGAARQFTIAGERLHMMIKRTIFARTDAESRYALNGAQLVITPTHDVMIATDGHRLAYIACNGASRPIANDIGVLIPAKTLTELEKLSNNHKGDVQFRLDDNHISFELGARQVISTMLTGEFPDYTPIIPKANDLRMMAHVGTLRAAVERVALMSPDKVNSLAAHLEAGQLRLQAQNADSGEATEVVEVQYAGEPLDIGLNAEYLADFLSSLKPDDAVEVQLKDAGTQVLIRPIGETGIDFKYVQAPMRL